MSTFIPGDWADPLAGDNFISPHRVVEHDWLEDGTDGLTRTVMTQDGSQAYSLAVASGLGVWSAPTADGNQRECWRFTNTHWRDSEMVSLLGRSDSFGVAPNLAQWGHLHRVQQQGDGTWRAVAVWTDVAFTVIPILNLGFISFDGASSLVLNTVNLSGDWAGMIRDFPILRAQRTSNVSTYWTDVPWFDSLVVGDVLAQIIGMANTSFNATNATVTAVDRSRRTFSIAQAAANATDADAGGVAQLPAPKNMLPMMLASRVVGSTVQAKRWRPEETEPDWSDPTHATSQTFTSGTPAPHSGPGDCGLWVAHLETPNKQRSGPVSCARIN